MDKRKIGFTLAEIIISMTIIGIIAAITIPALLVSTSEKALEAQKKALHARMSQAISEIDDLRVYGKSDGTTDKSSALNFLTKGLSKVYRIVKTCDKDAITNGCNFPSEVTLANGDLFKISEYTKLSDYISNSTVTLALDTEPAAFVTSNGESIVLFYNPNCYGSKTNGFYAGSAANAMCLNMIYDLNSADEAPNEFGKDIGFITVFFPKDPDIVLPVAYAVDATDSFANYNAAVSACKKQNSGLIIPSWQDGMSIALNKKLTNVSSNLYLVTGAGSTSAYQINLLNLKPSTAADFAGLGLRCIYNK